MVQDDCSVSRTLWLHSSFSSCPTSSILILSLIPCPHDVLHWDQSLHGVTGQLGSGISMSSGLHSGIMHFSCSTVKERIFNCIIWLMHACFTKASISFEVSYLNISWYLEINNGFSTFETVFNISTNPLLINICNESIRFLEYTIPLSTSKSYLL